MHNPKSTDSYLYLAKIFNLQDNKTEEEKNLNTVLLLQPSNEEGTLMLIDLKLDNSDFSTVSNLLDKFKKICKLFCSKEEEIIKRLENASDIKIN